MTTDQRNNLQAILDKAKVIMAKDRQKLIAEGKLEESFALLSRQQEAEQMMRRRMDEPEPTK